MNATISTGVFIATAILVVLLVAARLAIRSYGHRIGTDDTSFNQRPDPEHSHSRYANLQRIYTIASIAIGVWIIFLGAWMTLSAWTDYAAARRLGAQLSPGQVAGALGMIVVFIGIGLITIQSTLRWDHRPDRILAPRPAFRAPIVRRPSSHSNTTDFSALMQASGDSERPRPATHWYNANPGALWGILATAILVFLCYLALFILTLPNLIRP